MCIHLSIGILCLRDFASYFIDVGDDEKDDTECLKYFLNKFIQIEAPKKIEALFIEYAEKASAFGPEIQKYFRAAYERSARALL